VVARAVAPHGIGVRLDDGALVKCRAGEKFEEGDAVSVAVRPEAIQVEAGSGGTSPGDDHNRIRGRVASRTFLGQNASLGVVVGDAVVQVVAPADSTFVPGDDVTLVLPVRSCVAVRRDPGK
jgi:ABC-type Fe3+/spermidine/putrescine transport system ATPase subunit